MNILLVGLYAVSAFGACVGLIVWGRYGWGRGIVTMLYWIANWAMAVAAAADHGRLTYHERLAPDAIEKPTPEEIVRAVREGHPVITRGER